jgi:hypothetical protein
LSGTLEIETEGKRQQQEYESRMKTLQQENERLAILESKIDGLFSKYNINSKAHQTPEQP